MIQVLDRERTIFNLAKVQFLSCVQLLSLFRTASRRLDSLAYIESITDAYSQYFVNDIELTETINANYHLILSLK